MTVGYSAVNLANKFLDMLSGTAFTAPAGSFLKLHTADPGSAGATAAAAGSTTRVAITLAAAAAGSKSMNGTLPVWTNVTTTETISHLSWWDAVTAGNFLLSFALTAAQAWVNTNTFTLTSLTTTVTPIAA
jgi:hypothetical protein